MTTNEGVLERLHGALVEAIRERDPENLGRPFTVAEIYQDLVPYGTYRDVLGVEINGDYEHALLRLLAGEGDYLELESEHALREIREELESNNPNTGLYREFAAVDARLNLAHVSSVSLVGDGQEGRSHQPPAPAEETEMDDDDATAMDDDATGEEQESEVRDDDIQVMPLGAFASSTPLDPEIVDTEAPTAHRTGAPDVCRWCRETLPKRDNLNFCPFCGTDVRLIPCESCGEALEPYWRFCIACGVKAPGD